MGDLCLSDRCAPHPDWHRGSPAPSNFGDVFGLVWMLTVLPCFSAVMIQNSLVTGMATVVRLPLPPSLSPQGTPSFSSSPGREVETGKSSICVDVNNRQACVALQQSQ